MVTQVQGKYTGPQFGALISDIGLTANLFRSEKNALKVFNTSVSKKAVYSEAFKMAYAEYYGIPLAKVHRVYQEDSRWILEMDFVPGSMMIQRLHQALVAKDASEVRHVLHELAEIQYQIHSIRASELPGYIEYMGDQILNNPVLTEGQKKMLLTQLETMPDGESLIHGDYHPANIIYREDDGQPIVLDWMTAGRGCPAVDVARTYLNIKHPPIPWTEDGSIEVHTIYFEEYSKLSDMKLEDIQIWFPLVAGITCAGADPVFNKNMRQYLP